MGTEEGVSQRGVSESFESSWSKEDIGLNDHVGDGADWSVCDGGG